MVGSRSALDKNSQRRVPIPCPFQATKWDIFQDFECVTWTEHVPYSVKANLRKRGPNETYGT
jgi:hypothetical protein